MRRGAGSETVGSPPKPTGPNETRVRMARSASNCSFPVVPWARICTTCSRSWESPQDHSSPTRCAPPSRPRASVPARVGASTYPSALTELRFYGLALAEDLIHPGRSAIALAKTTRMSAPSCGQRLLSRPPGGSWPASACVLAAIGDLNSSTSPPNELLAITVIALIALT
jgi:hypothetical protein